MIKKEKKDENITSLAEVIMSFHIYFTLSRIFEIVKMLIISILTSPLLCFDCTEYDIQEPPSKKISEVVSVQAASSGQEITPSTVCLTVHVSNMVFKRPLEYFNFNSYTGKLYVL